MKLYKNELNRERLLADYTSQELHLELQKRNKNKKYKEIAKFAEKRLNTECIEARVSENLGQDYFTLTFKMAKGDED